MLREVDSTKNDSGIKVRPRKNSEEGQIFYADSGRHSISFGTFFDYMLSNEKPYYKSFIQEDSGSIDTEELMQEVHSDCIDIAESIRNQVPNYF